MFSSWKRFFNILKIAPKKSTVDKSREELLNEVLKARNEWKQARSYFNSVSDDGLTDHAILLCQAAEKKYVHLLRLAKQEGLVNNNISIS